MSREGLTFLKTDMRTKKYEKTILTSVSNTVNDLHYEIKLVIFGDIIALAKTKKY